MMTITKRILLCLAFFQSPLACSYAQWSWCQLDLENTWAKYKHMSATDLAITRWNNFQDTVPVAEMRAAFLAYHDKRQPASPYQGFDSTKAGRDKSLVLRQGLSTGTTLLLHAPQHYMGFVVSPYPTSEVFRKGKLIAHSGTPYGGGSDFFCFAQQSVKTHDGQWSDSIASGAKLMGTILHLGSATKQDWPECSFSVMVYEKSDKDSRDYPRYDVELLLPEKPNPHINFYLQSFKWFVKNLPYQTFKPYYTTDCRILLGRFYRVTVNKCGWLVEDYMDINNGEQGQQ